MERRKLTDEEISIRLAGTAGWVLKNEMLNKRWAFENFALALEFVNRVSVIAERLDHHPDINFGWGFAEVSTTTHDSGGITDFDFALAGKIDAE